MRQLDSCDFCGDAPEGVFEAVPASVAGGPVRLALCGDCQSTLRSVVDPLLGGDRESTPEATEARRREPLAAEAEGTAEAADDERTGGDAEASAGEQAGGEAAGAGDDEQAGGDAAGGGEVAGDAEAASDDGDGVTVEEQGGGTPARRPAGYAQVLRLLQNRDGPITRTDLRALATNAYDLTVEEYEAAVDAAIEHGDVEDTATGLQAT